MKIRFLGLILFSLLLNLSYSQNQTQGGEITIFCIIDENSYINPFDSILNDEVVEPNTIFILPYDFSDRMIYKILKKHQKFLFSQFKKKSKKFPINKFIPNDHFIINGYPIIKYESGKFSLIGSSSEPFLGEKLKTYQIVYKRKNAPPIINEYKLLKVVLPFSIKSL